MELSLLVYLDPALAEEAQALAGDLKLDCVDGSVLADAKPRHFQRFLEELPGKGSNRFVLVLDREGLGLYGVGAEFMGPIRADFHGSTVTYRRKHGGGKGQMIAKAVGLKGGVYPRVLDATAGLGGDAFVLASLGCEVTLLERVPVVRALLADGLKRGLDFARAEDPKLLEILGRMTLHEGDSLRYIKALREADLPDVTYLDPMFPERTKSAKVKKEMRAFHALVGSDPDAASLLEAALARTRYRVVVKRPRVAPALKGPAPSHMLEGKRNRYDVYALRKLPERLNA